METELGEATGVRPRCRGINHSPQNAATTMARDDERRCDVGELRRSEERRSFALHAPQHADRRLPLEREVGDLAPRREAQRNTSPGEVRRVLAQPAIDGMPAMLLEQLDAKPHDEIRVDD